MRFFAIDLNVSIDGSSIRSTIIRIFGLASSIFAIIIATIINAPSFSTEKDGDSIHRERATIGDIEHNFFHISELIFEALLLVYTLIKWTSLWKTTEQMESRLRYDSNFYQQLRKVSIALVVIFLILVRQVLHFKERKANKQKLNLV